MSQVTSIYAERRRSNHLSSDEMVWIPGGTFLMGCNNRHPNEAPAREVHVDGFWIDRYPVTNERFRAFVRTTGYITAAERGADRMRRPDTPPDLRHPGSLVLVQPPGRTGRFDSGDWWVYMRGADWRHPHGPHTTLDDLNRHPVVHVTYQDAEVFARWAGKVLPTEAQWEYAARGGGHRRAGDTGRGALPGGTRDRNVPWRTWPVDASAANGYGLHDMIGNVWEWTADEYAANDAGALSEMRGVPRDVRAGDERAPYKVLKGGSYSCVAGRVDCDCPAARLPQRMDLSALDVGFRCVLPARRGYGE